jgi:hypothetical protein
LDDAGRRGVEILAVVEAEEAERQSDMAAMRVL